VRESGNVMQLTRMQKQQQKQHCRYDEQRTKENNGYHRNKIYRNSMRKSGNVMQLMCMQITTTQNGTAVSTENAQGNKKHKTKKQRTKQKRSEKQKTEHKINIKNGFNKNFTR